MAASIAGLWLVSVGGWASDWPQWRGPGRDGVWNEPGVMTSFPPSGLEIVWRTPVGRGWSSPVVAAGKVYVTDAQVKRPTAIERICCFNESNGKQIWSHEYTVDYPDWAFAPDAGGPRATPIVCDGRLFTLGATGRLFCFDVVDGRIVWEMSLKKEYGNEPFSGITPSPLIEDDLLILFICGKPEACVVALNKDSGREVWRALDDSFTYSSPIVITAGGKRQLIVWTQEAVTSLDPLTGQTWWRERFRTPGDTAVSTPVVAGDLLLVAGLMLKLDADKPAMSVLWPDTKAVSRRVFSNTSTGLIQGGHVYSAKTTGELICVEAGTGNKVWEVNTVTDLKNGSSIHLTPNGDSVLLFTNQGNLIRARLDARGYEELGRTHLIDPTHPFNGRNVVWPPPAYANRRVFARSDQELVCASLAARAGE